MPDDTPPRVSILIPNYNNGKQSSRNGQDDLLGGLLESLILTLNDDPTPLEIIAYDDGSTDDSLQTLREGAQKVWRQKQPFLELIEASHCGVLSRTANILSRRAKGDILVRLDGDIVCLTPNWVQRLVHWFDQSQDRLGVIGPKQLKPNGRIHAYGDFILHPSGYVHIANDFPRDSVNHPLEVEHVMGCFYCYRKQVFEELGGYDENFLRGQTIDFGLRARKAGWRCLAVPDIEFVHNHTLRQNRKTQADTQQGIDRTLEIFQNKWGFNRLAPDLEQIQQQYQGSPLLWNKLFFGPTAWTPPPSLPVQFQSSEWIRYTQDEAFQKKINLRIIATMDVIKQSTSVPEKLLILGIGDGLVTHLLANRGAHCLAMDERKTHITFATQCVANQSYPNQAPRFEHLTDARNIPLEEASVQMILMDRMLERHPNPVRLLREAKRVLCPGCFLIIVSERRPSIQGIDPSDPATFKHMMTQGRRYQWLELVNQVQASGWQIVVDIFKDDRSRDMVLIAQHL